MGLTIYRALILNPLAPDRLDILEPGYLTVEDQRIVSLTSDDPAERFPGAARVDLDDAAIIPGLIDTHVHLPQLGIVGIGASELLEWLRLYTFPEEARLRDPRYAAVVSREFFRQLAANGTTTAVIYSSVHEEATHLAFEAARDTGVRAFIGKVMMDRNVPPELLEDPVESLAASRRLERHWDGYDNGRLRYVYTPRFAPACSPDLMRRVADAARDSGAYIQSHLSENAQEIAWVRDLFPEFPTYADVYNGMNLLGPRTLMAHCIHLGDTEAALLARTGTGVAFCPASNRSLHSGIMPYHRWRQHGLRIGLGSDIAGGPTLSMFRQMGEAIYATRDLGRSAMIPPREALYLATLGGASTLGIDQITGNLAPGKEADFVVLDLKAVDPLGGQGACQTPEALLWRLCFTADRSVVRNVFVRGRRLQATT